MILETQAAAPAPRPAADRLDEAIDLAANHLLELQNAEGYWNGELEADTTLESDYILFHLWMDPPKPGQPWRPRAWGRILEAARYIRGRQTPSGGWCIYPGGPDNLSACVKAYFALKLAGDHPDQSHMRAARDRILELGGLERANSYTRIYLSFFGLYDRARIPTIPPELILLSRGSYLNLYEMSSWTRAIVVPLSILCALRPSRPVPDGFTLNELLSRAPDAAHEGIFWTLDHILKLWESSGFLPHRQEAIRKCERWILDRLEHSDGLGAIFPSMLNSILALHLLGYPDNHPVLARAIRQLEDLVIREGGTLRLRPCCSPVWDTAIAAYALGVAGFGDHPGLAAAADWLLSKEVRRKGDWAVKNPNLEPGGWYFEFANEFYPDIDDTAMVLLALEQAQSPDRQAQRAAQRRGLQWVLGMQSQDGGWAAFDRDNNRQILNQVPFADHNAMLDPTCADITGRVLEALGAAGWGDHPAVARGIEYLWRTQEPDGSWAGRWGVHYIYGTCFALRGLRAAGVNPREARSIQAGEFLRSYQNPDGGWGESCASYDDPGSKATGPSTASQTAWALLGLFAGGDYSTVSVQRGIEYLLATQTRDGRWEEPWFTGTGFPRVFYLKYHLYSQYFPLLVLAEYRARPTRTTL
jgi:squalene-hopene/tetraprenyl-beta-curcumene cyclase